MGRFQVLGYLHRDGEPLPYDFLLSTPVATILNGTLKHLLLKELLVGNKRTFKPAGINTALRAAPSDSAHRQPPGLLTVCPGTSKGKGSRILRMLGVN